MNLDSFLLTFLYFLHKLLKINCQHLQEILFISFILSQGELETFLMFLNIIKIGIGIDPFQPLTALSCKPVCSLHKLRLRQFYLQLIIEIFSLCEDVDLLVAVSCGLVEDVSFGAMVHFLHDFFLSVDDLIRLLFIYMAFEVVFMVWLPSPGTHIAKTLPAGTGHIVASHRPFYCLIAPRTHLSISAYPLSVCLFLDNLFDPFRFLLAVAGVMVIALTFKTENLAAGASNSL